MSTSPENHSNSRPSIRSVDKRLTLHDNPFAANHLDRFTLAVRCEMGLGMLSWPLARLNKLCGNFSNAYCLAVTVVTVTENFQIVTGHSLVLFFFRNSFQSLNFVFQCGAAYLNWRSNFHFTTLTHFTAAKYNIVVFSKLVCSVIWSNSKNSNSRNSNSRNSNKKVIKGLELHTS